MEVSLKKHSLLILCTFLATSFLTAHEELKEDWVPVNTVICSVSDKSGLIEFIGHLKDVNPTLEVLASGGTAKALFHAGISHTLIQDYTGFPECFSGRVKTLHPKIEGGILFKRGEDAEEAKKLGIHRIDLVVCNLYDFAKAAQNPDAKMVDLVEDMDIGGSTLIRSACKNFSSVAVLVDPMDYSSVVEEMAHHNGCLSLETRVRLAVKAMRLSAVYDTLIADTFHHHLPKDMGN